jgi:hypothetical protein
LGVPTAPPGWPIYRLFKKTVNTRNTYSLIRKDALDLQGVYYAMADCFVGV